MSIEGLDKSTLVLLAKIPIFFRVCVPSVILQTFIWNPARSLDLYTGYKHL
jgi:hypothetical protein